MPPEENQETPEEILARMTGELEQLKSKNQELATSVQKLEAKKSEAIGEIRKRKRIADLLEAAGLDIKDENAENILAERLKLAAGDEDDDEDDDDTIAPTNKDNKSQGAGSGETDVVKRSQERTQLREARALLKKAQKKAEDLEKEKATLLAQREADLIKQIALEAYRKAGSVRPEHLLKLTRDDLRLSEDGKTVLTGSEWDPKTITELAAELKDDEDYSIYFGGTGSTGSGMSGNSSGGANGFKGDNPFHVDTKNATAASVLMKNDPEKAKQLMAMARMAGKLDPVLAKAFQSLS